MRASPRAVCLTDIQLEPPIILTASSTYSWLWNARHLSRVGGDGRIDSALAVGLLGWHGESF